VCTKGTRNVQPGVVTADCPPVILLRRTAAWPGSMSTTENALKPMSTSAAKTIRKAPSPLNKRLTFWAASGVNGLLFAMLGAASCNEAQHLAQHSARVTIARLIAERVLSLRAEASLMSEPSTATPDQTFYTYEGPDGRVQLVDSLEKLPAEVRPKAKRTFFSGHGSTGQDTLGALLTGEAGTRETASSAQAPASLTFLHVPSFALGVAAGLGVFFIVRWLSSPSETSFGKRLVLSLVLAAGLVAVLSSLYLGWLRRSTGQTDGLIATPTEVIDDAKRTMQLVEERRKAQQKQLDELEHVK
jgi:hypothetical protein